MIALSYKTVTMKIYTPFFVWGHAMIPPCTSYILSIELLIANCTKQKQRCSAAFTFLATSCFQSQEVFSKCRLSFRLFASRGHKRNPSRRSWVASRFLRSAGLDELALCSSERFQNEMCDKWLDETCVIGVPIFCCLVSLHCHVPGYMMYVLLVVSF